MNDGAMNDRMEELLFAWEDDALSEAEVEELAALLEGNAAGRQAAVEHFALSCAISEQLRESLHDESVVQELQVMASRDRQLGAARQKGRAWSAFAATAAVLLMATLVGYHFEVHTLIFGNFGGQAVVDDVVDIEELRPEITGTFGQIQLVGTDGSSDISAGATLDLGQSLRTSKNSYATLEYPDGTKIELRGDTQITIEPNRSGKHLSLQRGSLFAAVAPQPAGAPLVVNPNRYDRVEVVGTRFEIARDDAGRSAVRVTEGKVRFGAKDAAVEVTQRQESTVSSGNTPAIPQAIEVGSIWRGWSHGLRGDYYDSMGFGGRHFTRIDPRVDFHWGKTDPDPEFHNEFSVRWTGRIEAPHSGEFTFYTIAHYGIRLWVDGRSLIDSGASMGAEEDSRPIQLEKGKRYPIKIEYWDRHGDAKMRLLWSSESMPKAIVDSRWLIPAIADEDEKRLK